MLNSKTFTRIFFTGIFLTSLFSCKKDDVTEPSGGGNGSSGNSSKVTAYISSRTAPTQTFTVSTSTTQSITTDEGSSITIPANAFTDLNGNPISGDVTVEVVEIFKKSDMMKSNRPTVSNGQVLISGGEYFISATTTTGDSLLLDENATISVQTPITDNIEYDMGLFVGDVDEEGQFNWEQLVGDSARTVNQSVYMFTADTLGWINIDKFYNSTTTTLTINLGEGATTEKALTFIVFNNLNSVLSPSTYQGTVTDNSYIQNMIPVGEEVTIICIAEIDNTLQMASEELTTTENAVVNLTFDALSEEEIDTFLESFDD